MKTDFRHRIIYISAIIACSLTSASLLSGVNLLLPSVLFVVLIGTNTIPFRLLKSKGIQTNFGSNFRILILLNSAVFLPFTIYNVIPFTLDLDSILGILAVLTVVFVIALTGSLLFSPMPDSKPIKEDMGAAMYELKDILLQPKPDPVHEGKNKAYIPTGTIKGKTMGFKIAIWVMIGFMFLIPLYATVENGFLMYWHLPF